jgi:4-amino-4-deoxy-L-arabinose transferase-like glycosyltransferase
MRRSRDEAPGRIRRARERMPAGLAGLLAAVLLVGLAWALLVPPWQSPDEVAHFGYTESLAARHAFPGKKGLGEISTDQLQADSAVGASRGAFYPASVPPSWSPQVFRAFVAASSHLSRTDGGGPNAASTNPPLYYLYADIAYLADIGGNAFGRLYAVRIWGVLLLELTALGGWLLAGEVFGRRRLVQLVCGAVAALLPMTTFISTSVNPDAMMIVLWTWAMWLGVRVVRRSAQRPDAVALGLVTAAAVLTKATSYALVVPTVAALVLGWRRGTPERRRAARTSLGLGLVALAVPILVWLGIAVALHRPAVNTISSNSKASSFNPTQFLSYVWQFYLPRLSFLTPLRETTGLPIYDVWIRQGWATFGWLDVTFPDQAYAVLGAISAAVLVPAAFLLAKVVNRRNWAVVAYLALSAFALLVFLHGADYRSLIAGQGPLLQGRYLLPIVALFGLSVAFLTSRLPVAYQAAVCGAVLVALLTLQVLSLSTVMHAYYT